MNNNMQLNMSILLFLLPFLPSPTLLRHHPSPRPPSFSLLLFPVGRVMGHSALTTLHKCCAAEIHPLLNFLTNKHATYCPPWRFCYIISGFVTHLPSQARVLTNYSMILWYHPCLGIFSIHIRKHKFRHKCQ